MQSVAHFLGVSEGADLHLYSDRISSMLPFCCSFQIACLLLSMLTIAGRWKLRVLNVSLQCLCSPQTLRPQLEQTRTDALPQSGPLHWGPIPSLVFAGLDCDAHTTNQNMEHLG